jgi:hypothetical protein
MNMKSYIPKNALRAVEQVLRLGAKKHGGYDWKFRLMTMDGLLEELEHIENHLNAIRGLRLTDRESGLPHAAHVAARALFITSYTLTRLRGKISKRGATGGLK